MSTVEVGKLEDKVRDLKEEMKQLLGANEEMRTAVESCEKGEIEGYPDLELAHIN